MRILSFVAIASSAILLANCASTNQQSPIYQQSTVYKGSTPQTQIVQAAYQTQAPAPVTYGGAQPSPYAAQSTQPQGYAQNSECLSREGNRKLLGGVAGGAVGALAGRKIAGKRKTLGTVVGASLGSVTGYGIAGRTINCDPIAEAPRPQARAAAPVYQQPAPIYQQPAPIYQQPAPQAPAYTAPAPSQSSAYQYNTPGATRQTTGTRTASTSIHETTTSLGAQGTPGYYAVHGGSPTAQPTTLASTTQPIYANTSSINQRIGSKRTYTILPGDNVYRLAKNNCTSVEHLKQLNGINDNFYIRAGDQILIPSENCAK